MRRVWVAVVTTWALVAIVALLAWGHRPSGATAQAGAQAVVVRGAGGSTHVVLVPSGSVHGTTQTSSVAGATPISLATGAGATPAATAVTGG